MSAHGRLVVKVGGSLLTRPRWPDAVAALLAGLSRPCLLVVGGGTVVDGLRAIDAAAPQPSAVMHRLAIDAMRLTAAIVAESLALPVVASVDHGGTTTILDVAAWLATTTAVPQLPEDWSVTSDSLAALVAASLVADLLLAKSVPPPGGSDDLRSLAADGWVDAAFPEAARGVTAIRWAAPVTQ